MMMRPAALALAATILAGTPGLAGAVENTSYAIMAPRLEPFQPWATNS